MGVCVLHAALQRAVHFGRMKHHKGSLCWRNASQKVIAYAWRLQVPLVEIRMYADEVSDKEQSAKH